MILQKSKPSPNKEELLLRQELAATKMALDSAYSNLEYVIEPELIDSYIYQLKSIQLRYRFLLNQAKSHCTYDKNPV